MQYRLLGRSGLHVSAISLGGWVTYGGHVDPDATFKCMEAAYRNGINFFDCAEAYSQGESERVMGQAIKKFGWKRNDLVISTKLYWGSAYGDNPINNKGLSRKHIVEGMNMALERLGIDYVDLIYAHRPDRLTPMEETVRAFNHLIDQGKAFYWGTSEWDADEIADAWRHADRLGLIGPVMEQPQYNMLERDRVENQYMRLFQNHGLGLTTWSPLRFGILTGKYDEGIPEGSRFATATDAHSSNMTKTYGDEKWKATLEKVKKLQPIAEKLGTNRANLALAWVLSNKNISSAIIGASKPEQIDENVKALEIIEKLTPEIKEEIEKVLENKPAAHTPRF